MYKVLIVDDERLIRITLKNLIDWNAFDCEVIATAKDGEEALRLCDVYHPEIVITDLKMPGMDGIQLITKIKEQSATTQVIALSNYSDYEFVRDAMKAGAYDYLLKVTLEKKELENIITQVKECCVTTNASADEACQSAIKELSQCLLLTKNEHVVKAEEYDRVLALPYFQSYKEHYQIAYFRVDNIKRLYEIGKLKDHGLLKSHLRDLFQESIPASIEHTTLFISSHSGLLLFNTAEKLRVLNICNSIIRNITQYLDIHISITLSDAMHSFAPFLDAYEQLLKTHEQRFYMGDGSLLQSEEHKEFQPLVLSDVQFHIELLEAMQTKNYQLVPTIQQNALQYMEMHNIEPTKVLDYVIFIINNVEGNEIAKGLKRPFSFGQMADQIRMCETLCELDQIVKSSFQKIEAWLKDARTNMYRKEILDVIAYIENNLDQRISVQMLCEHFDMSTSSLSRMFKHETGKTLNYFINEKKMKKAKELLMDDMRIKDVAAAIGMEDQLYFNKVFKRYYHASPSEIRKKMNVQ